MQCSPNVRELFGAIACDRGIAGTDRGKRTGESSSTPAVNKSNVVSRNVSPPVVSLILFRDRDLGISEGLELARSIFFSLLSIKRIRLFSPENCSPSGRCVDGPATRSPPLLLARQISRNFSARAILLEHIRSKK
jgi:hypothetical protein